MPIPERILKMAYVNDEMNEPTFLDRAVIKHKISLWPRRCRISKKIIWLEDAYRATRMYTGPGEPVYEHRWYKRHEFLLWRIKWGV